MTLKTVITADEHNGLDDAIKPLYTKEGDGFVLDTDGKSKINEFRSNNIKLMQQMSDLKAQLEPFKDVNLEELLKNKDELQQIKDKKLLDSGEIEELLVQRTERMRQDYDARLEAGAKAIKKYEERSSKFEKELSDLKVKALLLEQVEKVARIRTGAMADVLSRARNTWSLDEEGNPIPMEKGTIKYGTDTNPLTMQEYVVQLVKDAPHLFELSQGSGATGSTGTQTGNGIGTMQNPDADAFGRNLESIAAGKVKIVR